MRAGNFGLDGVAKCDSTGAVHEGEVTQSKTVSGVRGVRTPAGEEVFILCGGDALCKTRRKFLSGSEDKVRQHFQDYQAMKMTQAGPLCSVQTQLFTDCS